VIHSYLYFVPALFCFPEPPIFKGDYPSNWIEPLGGNAVLNCEVKGEPASTIHWSRRGVDVEISHRIRQLGNGSLAIYGTVVSHPGVVDELINHHSECPCRTPGMKSVSHPYLNHKT
jgi:hypothetical protein